MPKDEMTPEEHKQCHVELHQSLDILLADFLRRTNKRLTETKVIDLMM